MSDSSRQAFAEACGLAGPLELLLRRPGEAGGGQLCLFDQPFVFLGRDVHNDLRLDGVQIGRRHAYLQVIGGHLFVVDLDSRDGTRWEGEPRPFGWLAPGEALRIGPYEVRLVRAGGERAAAPAWSPTETRRPDASGGWPAVVELSREGRTEARCRLTRVLTLVGRSPACRLRLSSRTVSRYHCALLRTATAVWAVDLRGRGGLRVGGTPVPFARLADGDQVEVGAFALRLRGIKAAGAAPAGAGAADPEAGERLRLPSAHTVILSPAATLPAPPSVGPLVPSVPLDAAALGPVVQQFGMMQQQMFDQFHQAMLAMVQMFGALHRDQMGLIREELNRLRDVTQELHSLQAELAAQAPPAAAPPAATTNGTAALAQPPAERPAPAAGAGPKPEGGKAPAAGPAAPAAAPQGDGTIHVWLSQRIAALEQERQTRWQKVMSFVLGK